MKERPILFNGEMVRAVLDGRKTQTRRVVKPQPHPGATVMGCILESTDRARKRGDIIWSMPDGKAYSRPPYGVPGDRLWVRETHAKIDWIPAMETKVLYRADEQFMGRPWIVGGHEIEPIAKWTPSIHMPRWASRILLEVVSVRVERVKEISEEDASKEGTTPIPHSRESLLFGTWSARHRFRDGFQRLWNSINAKRGYGWDVNPWVWVVEFKRVEG